MKLEAFDAFRTEGPLPPEGPPRHSGKARPRRVADALLPACGRPSCKTAIDHIAMALVLSRHGTILEANDKFHEISGFAPRDILGHAITDFMAEDPATLGRDVLTALRHGAVWRGDISFVARHGGVLWADLTLVPQRGGCCTIDSFTLLGLDITDRKQAELSAVEERRRREDMECLVKDIVDTVPNGIVAYDEAGKVIFFNDAHTRLYDSVATGIAIGRDRSSLVPPQYRKFLLSPDSSGGRVSDLATHCSRSFVQKLPGERWIQVQNRRSTAGRLISVQTDVTGLKRAEKHIKHQATRDPLTGLCNRTVLFNRLARSSADKAEAARPYALLLIDLDDFKGINDSYGHDAGDAFLQQFAHNLRAAVRRGDIVARLGGDEFAVVLRDLHAPDDIVAILEKLKREISGPLAIGNRTLIPSASIGVACFPRDAIEPKELMKSADHALYHCKQNGRGGFSLYDMSMRRRLARRAYLCEELRLTLDRQEIGVVLQPQRDMTNGRHFGFEALVRWSVMGEAIPPLELISIAEEAGLVRQLSYQVIEKTLGIVGRLRQRGLDPGIMAFNIAASQLYDPAFPARLGEILDTHGTSPAEIELEVTENVILDRSADVIAKAIHDLHAMGFAIALDDFGTGYASLTHLKRFPIDRLKIDRSFISGFEQRDQIALLDNDDFIISRTIVSLAHNLGLKVVAEGIETRRQYEELSNIGCDFAQGYLIGRPMNEQATTEYLSRIDKSYFI